MSRRIRGIRDPIRPGHFLGRVSPGLGRVEEVPFEAAAETLGVPPQEQLLPAGGTTGQVLVKAGDNDYNVTWDDVEPPGFRGALVRNTSPQSIPDTTPTFMTWDFVEYDTDSIFDISNPTRLTVPAGVSFVQVMAGIVFAANTTGVRQFFVRKNGGNFVGRPTFAMNPPATGNASVVITSPVVPVTAGDYFEAQGFQTSTGALDANPGTSGDFGHFFHMRIIE